ncbi:DUF1931 family protein [Leifsonia sp. fls2-241-R2A-40a]|uniref:DUF1931 family protein n=1 Tax=Leifsonia sp. fls2-241-R2A-40a TaxID=3040290 RepID=UPI00254A67AA|nr:DUF1931 family protein [Leifsonia sp. fls2-241-R2A-40a]
MQLFGIANFERFFRQAASLDVDKDDLRRFDDFVNDRIYDLLLRGVANAKANGRDILEPQDLPITKGLQESIHAFEEIDEDVSMDAILEQLTRRPPLDISYSDETAERLPQIAGGLGVAVARTIRILDEKVKNPQTEHWEKAERVFDVLL